VVSAGVQENNSMVWRFTPDGRDGVAHDVAGMLSTSESGVTVGKAVAL
jgi:hypothetical protein